MFLHGKRNRRLDHLINTLIREVCPYFAVKFHRNRLGFEGQSLEEQKLESILKQGKTIPESSVKLLNESELEVQSQSTKTKTYHITVSPTFCSCFDFPLIRFCKHLYAAKQYHPDLVWESSEMRTSELPHAKESFVPEGTNDSIQETPTPPQFNKAVNDIVALANSLYQRSSLPGASEIFDVEKLVIAQNILHDILVDSTLKKPILPPTEKLPPNKKTRTETAEAYKRKVPMAKSKRKSTNTDPYGGGERSGKKAKPDALMSNSTPDSMPTTTPRTRERNLTIQQSNRTVQAPIEKTKELPKPPPPNRQPTSAIAQSQTFQASSFVPYYYYYYPTFHPYAPQMQLAQHHQTEPIFSSLLLPPDDGEENRN